MFENNTFLIKYDLELFTGILKNQVDIYFCSNVNNV